MFSSSICSFSALAMPISGTSICAVASLPVLSGMPILALAPSKTSTNSLVSKPPLTVPSAPPADAAHFSVPSAAMPTTDSPGLQSPLGCAIPVSLLPSPTKAAAVTVLAVNALAVTFAAERSPLMVAFLALMLWPPRSMSPSNFSAPTPTQPVHASEPATWA